MNPRYKWIIAAVAVGAVALRLVLAAAQLPFHYQSDEFQVVERALRVGAGEWNPGLFTWPGTLVIYLDFFVFALYFLTAKLANVARDAAAFADLYWRAPGMFYFLGRALSAAFGALAVVAAARWAREAVGEVGAYAAAAFVALAPAALAASAVALPDMAAAALGIAALAAGAVYAGSSRPKCFVFAGALLGLGAAAKYHVLLFAPALAAYALSGGGTTRQRLKVLICGTASTLIAFVAACPFAVLDARRFFGDLALLAARPGMIRIMAAPGYALKVTFPYAASWPLLVIAVAGAVALGRRRGRHALATAVAAAPFVVAALLRFLPPRHILPLMGPFALAAGAMTEVAFRNRGAGFRRRLVAVAVTLLFAAALTQDVTHIAWSWRKDARTAAAAYVETHVPAGSVLVLENVYPDTEGPPLWPERETLARLVKFYRLKGGGSPGKYAYFLKSPAYPFGRRVYKIFLVLATQDFAAVPRPAYALRTRADDRDYYAEQAKSFGVPLAPWEGRYDEFLTREGRALKIFSGAGRPGPTVEIYKLP